LRADYRDAGHFFVCIRPADVANAHLRFFEKHFPNADVRQRRDLRAEVQYSKCLTRNKGKETWPEIAQ
jgi:hypothetical protein